MRAIECQDVPVVVCAELYKTKELHLATLGCLRLGTYQQLNLSCANDTLIYVVDVRHGHSNQSRIADEVTCPSPPDMTSPVSDESWCVDRPPYDEMVIIQCNSQSTCTVDTAEMSSAMYTCHGYVTDVIQATYLCLAGITTRRNPAVQQTIGLQVTARGKKLRRV